MEEDTENGENAKISEKNGENESSANAGSAGHTFKKMVEKYENEISTK